MRGRRKRQQQMGLDAAALRRHQRHDGDCAPPHQARRQHVRDGAPPTSYSMRAHRPIKMQSQSTGEPQTWATFPMCAFGRIFMLVRRVGWLLVRRVGWVGLGADGGEVAFRRRCTPTCRWTRRRGCSTGRRRRPSSTPWAPTGTPSPGPRPAPGSAHPAGPDQPRDRARVRRPGHAPARPGVGPGNLRLVGLTAAPAAAAAAAAAAITALVRRILGPWRVGRMGDGWGVLAQ